MVAQRRRGGSACGSTGALTKLQAARGQARPQLRIIQLLQLLPRCGVQLQVVLPQLGQRVGGQGGRRRQSGASPPAAGPQHCSIYA